MCEKRLSLEPLLLSNQNRGINRRELKIMELLLDLNSSNGVWIDGSHRVFEGSEFQGLGFRVKVKPLTRTELRKIRKESNTKSGMDQDQALPTIFRKQVLDWELKAADGQAIPFTDQMKDVLIENFPTFTNLIAAACLDTCVKTDEVLQEEIKN